LFLLKTPSFLQAGADIVMLDNFEAGPMKEVAGRLKGRHPHILIEGSGGLTESNLADFFSPGWLPCPPSCFPSSQDSLFCVFLPAAIDVLSMGSMSQSVPHIDFSLKILQKEKK